jgi:DNA repair ATPase RecN/predicted phosphodiesterase
MSKILLVSDIHIYDYTNRCPSPQYRLYQSRAVTQNIIEVGKTEGCERIAFLGDICERSIVKPYIQAEVKLFLDTIMNNFKEGYILWGNHDDANSRSTDTMGQSIIDSFLGVMLPPNLHYADKTVINIDNSSVAFCNWAAKPDLSWIKAPVDILMTHATINYDNNAAYKSQELDESKFQIAFCGDIHKAAVKYSDNIGWQGTPVCYVSVGNAQKCKMGDDDNQTGVVVDFSDKSWHHVNLNPHDNLLKFIYTSNLEEEGYHQETNTWYVYKPENVIRYEKDNIKVDAWTEIEHLINDAVTKSNLQVIHTEVLKNASNFDDFVDFSFELKHLRCENWRSITSADIEFSKGDKIYLAGANGSGKSSLLSALSYALMDVSSTQGLVSLKPFIQYGKSYCWTEVEFSFQGHDYRIRRGTNSKDNCLWINGVEQKYGSKRDFEEDVRNRFKFLQYLFDCMFYSSEHHRFIGGMTSERKTEIMAKFLRLDRINNLYVTSQNMYENVKKEKSNWDAKIKETEKIINYIQEKLSLLTIPGLTRDQLESLKAEGIELQRKNKLWTEYVTKTANLQGKIQTYTNTLNDLYTKQRTFRNPDLIDKEIESINQSIQGYHTRLVELGNIRVNLEYKTKEYNNLRNEGNNAWKEAQSLSLGRKCSSCGQTIKNTADMENHKNELMKKVEELRPKIQQLQQEIQDLTNQQNNSAQEYNQINLDIQNLNSEISKRMTEKNIIENTKKDIINYKQLLDRSNAELSSLGFVEQVELPSDFFEKMSSIEADINNWIQYEANRKDLDDRLVEITNLKQEAQTIEQYLLALEAYGRLTGPVGIIYEEILNKLKDAFSDNNVVYKVVRSGKGAREHLDLVPMFKKGTDEIEYFSCSSGEKTLLDIHLLDKLISSAGILVLDETLKNLDPDRLFEVLSILGDINVNLLILTSHSEGISGFYNRVINLSINEQGLTEIN